MVIFQYEDFLAGIAGTGQTYVKGLKSIQFYGLLELALVIPARQFRTANRQIFVPSKQAVEGFT